MTRTGLSSELLKEEEEPYLLMNGSEAQEMNIQQGDKIKVSNALGSLELIVRFGDLAPKHLFSPFGYSSAPINTLVFAVHDPFSFQTAFKSAKVTLSKF